MNVSQLYDIENDLMLLSEQQLVHQEHVQNVNNEKIHITDH